MEQRELPGDAKEGMNPAALLRERLIRYGLTCGEAEVAVLATEGLSNQRIAGRCCFSLNTVKSYLSRAYAKLGVENRVQLTARLVTLNDASVEPASRPSTTL